MGRKIFARCLDAFLQIRASMYSRDIHEELISNEVRIKEAKNTFKRNQLMTRNKPFVLFLI